MLIKNTDDAGNETFWLIESGARTTLERQAVSLDRLEVGSKIKATGRKVRREYTLYLKETIFADGTVFVPQPGLNESDLKDSDLNSLKSGKERLIQPLFFHSSLNAMRSRVGQGLIQEI